MQPGERRQKYRKGLSTLYLPKYDALCAALPVRWAPFYGLRSFQEQAALYARGRTIAPVGPEHILTKAKAGESGHNYGCASDWTIWDENDQPLWIKKEDPRWSEYQLAISQNGLRWGGDFPTLGDCYHNELLIHCDWKHILLAYQQGGMTAAQQHIEANEG